MKKKHDVISYILVVLLVIVIGAGVYRFMGGGNFYSNAALSEMALEYYQENYTEGDDDGSEAVVRNFGCHKEIHIFRQGQLVMRLSFVNGKLYEL